MDFRQFFAASAVTIVAGKGGVGKTTVAATLALAAAKTGLRVTIVEIEGKSGISRLFGHGPLKYDDQLLWTDPSGGDGRVQGRALTADHALVEYLRDHGLNRISKRLADSGALDIVTAATPGIKDVLLLGKVKQLERSAPTDLVIVDAPAAGHAISFLKSAQGLLNAIAVGPIETQAREVQEMLTDPSRCQVVLVTLAQETPMNEVIETAYQLEDEVGVKLGPVVINGLYPPLPGLETPLETAVAEANAAGWAISHDVKSQLGQAAEFRRERAAMQREQTERLHSTLPLPQMHLDLLFDTEFALPALETLAEILLREIDALPPLPEWNTQQ